MDNEQKLENFDASPAAADARANAEPKSIWEPKVGDKAFFFRGMFGLTKGTIRRLYLARGSVGLCKNTLLAEVSFTGRNGKAYLRRGVVVHHMAKDGLKPTLKKGWY
jgi:hypothetical protein